MATAELSRRLEKVVAYPPLSELDDLQRREFHEALLEAGSFEDLPGKWQAAILEAEQNRPKPSGREQRVSAARSRAGYAVYSGWRSTRMLDRGWETLAVASCSSAGSGARPTARAAGSASAYCMSQTPATTIANRMTPAMKSPTVISYRRRSAA